MADGAAIRFLPFAGRRVAYAVTGEGPPVVAPAWWISHLELDWADAAFRGFWESVCAGYTLVRYDRLGVGMSDHEVHDDDLTLDTDVSVLRAVLDELSLDKVTMPGWNVKRTMPCNSFIVIVPRRGQSVRSRESSG